MNDWQTKAACSALLAVSLWSLRETHQVKEHLLVESRRSADLERTRGELEGRLEASGRELRQLRETSARRAEEQEQQVAGLRRQLRAAQVRAAEDLLAQLCRRWAGGGGPAATTNPPDPRAGSRA